MQDELRFAERCESASKLSLPVRARLAKKQHDRNCYKTIIKSALGNDMYKRFNGRDAIFTVVANIQLSADEKKLLDTVAKRTGKNSSRVCAMIVRQGLQNFESIIMEKETEDERN